MKAIKRISLIIGIFLPVFIAINIFAATLSSATISLSGSSTFTDVGGSTTITIEDETGADLSTAGVLYQIVDGDSSGKVTASYSGVKLYDTGGGEVTSLGVKHEYNGVVVPSNTSQNPKTITYKYYADGDSSNEDSTNVLSVDVTVEAPAIQSASISSLNTSEIVLTSTGGTATVIANGANLTTSNIKLGINSGAAIFPTSANGTSATFNLNIGQNNTTTQTSTNYSFFLDGSTTPDALFVIVKVDGKPVVTAPSISSVSGASTNMSYLGGTETITVYGQNLTTSNIQLKVNGSTSYTPVRIESNGTRAVFSVPIGQNGGTSNITYTHYFYLDGSTVASNITTKTTVLPKNNSNIRVVSIDKSTSSYLSYDGESVSITVDGYGLNNRLELYLDGYVAYSNPSISDNNTVGKFTFNVPRNNSNSIKTYEYVVYLNGLDTGYSATFRVNPYGESNSNSNANDTSSSAIDEVIEDARKYNDEVIIRMGNNSSVTFSEDQIEKIQRYSDSLILTYGKVTLNIPEETFDEIRFGSDEKVIITFKPKNVSGSLRSNLIDLDRKNSDLLSNLATTISFKTSVDTYDSFKTNLQLKYDLNSFKLTSAQNDLLKGIEFLDVSNNKYNDISGSYIERTKIFYYNTKIAGDFGVYIKNKNSNTNNSTNEVVKPPLVSSTQKIILNIGQTYYSVNGSFKVLDSAPIIEEDRTLVPIRFVAEALGANVTWNEAAETAYIAYGGKNIAVIVGVKTGSMDVAPKIVNDRIMVPIRYISEDFGATVNWNEASGTIEITK